MKRTLSLILSVFLIVLITACTGDSTTPSPEPQAAAPGNQETVIPAKPVIRLSITGEACDGLAGAFCWLQAANDIRCEPDPAELLPSDPITIEQGETVTITVASELGAPDALHATLLDDPDANNVPIVITFEPSESVDYTVDLGAGQHRLNMVAEYKTLESDTSFVSTVFALEIPAAVVVKIEPTAVPPTAEPTVAEPTATIAAEPTEAPTEVPPQVEPTEIPATAVPPTAVPQPTTKPAEGPLPPTIVVVNGSSQFLPSGTEYCVTQNGAETCAEIPGSARSMRILVKNGDTVRIDAQEAVPATLRIALKSNDLSQEFDSVELPGNAMALHTINGAAGSYVLVISAEWPEGTAIYYFRVQIGE